MARYQPVWLACALFVAKGAGAAEEASHAGDGLALSRVLTVLRVSETQFLRELLQFLERGEPALCPGTPGAALLTPDAARDLSRFLRVVPLQNMYLLSQVLANKYRQQFARFFKAPEGSSVRHSLTPLGLSRLKKGLITGCFTSCTRRLHSLTLSGPLATACRCLTSAGCCSSWPSSGCSRRFPTWCPRAPSWCGPPPSTRCAR